MELDARVRVLKTNTQAKTAEKNKITAQIATANADARTPLVAESKKIGAEIADELQELATAESNLNELLLSVPQIPSDNAPQGVDEGGNIEVKRVGDVREFSGFTPRPQWELLDMNGWWMPEKISEICGTRTYALMGEAAELDLAIQTFVIQKLIAKGFKFIQVPAIVKQSLFLMLDTLWAAIHLLWKMMFLH